MEFLETQNKAKVETIKHIATVKQDFKAQTDINDKKCLSESCSEVTKKRRVAWTAERKGAHSEKWGEFG